MDRDHQADHQADAGQLLARALGTAAVEAEVLARRLDAGHAPTEEAGPD
jgi:hypothetical protein